MFGEAAADRPTAVGWAFEVVSVAVVSVAITLSHTNSDHIVVQVETFLMSHGAGAHMSRAERLVRRSDRVTLAVAALAVAALMIRLAGLGSRPFHWSEGRVGYWTLRFLKTGAYSYRPVAGGPFLYIVDHWVFALVGANDYTARLVVAVVGGLLPLAALLFRTRLRDDETVVFAALLGASPVLVYYSRFLRGDVPLAAFSLVTVGAVVRAIDTGRDRELYLAGAAFALTLASSAFAAATLLCWAVAAFLVFDHARLLGRGRDTAMDRFVGYGRWVRANATPLARAFLLWFACFVFFYAPRAGNSGGPGLWKPMTWPAVLDVTLVGTVRKFFGVFVHHRLRSGGHPFIEFVTGYGSLLVVVAVPMLSLAVVAFFWDRYSSDTRSVVAFTSYWAGASLLVVPITTEFMAPWLTVHTVLPLALPAAVGGAALLRFASRGIRARSAAQTTTAVLFTLAIVVHVGAVASWGVYGANDRSNRLAQFAQPADDLKPMVANVSTAIAGNDGVDVVYVGDRFYTSDEAGNDAPPVPDEWGNRLPLPWYFERLGAATGSVDSPSGLDSLDSKPPVVVADPKYEGTLQQRYPNYRENHYQLGLWGREVLVFTKR